MIEIIETDFDVKWVAQNQENHLFLASKNENYHFVFFEEDNAHSSINQFYLHRFEIANFVGGVYESRKETSPFPLAGGHLQIAFSLSDLGPAIVFIKNQVSYSVLLSGSDFGELLMNDVKNLKKIYSENTKSSFDKKVITAITGEYDENKKYPFSERIKSIVAFEMKLFKSQKTWRSNSVFSQLLHLELQDSGLYDSYFLDDLIQSLPLVLNKTECDCGSEGCFFDMLYAAYTTFFQEDGLLTNGSIDEGKVYEQLTELLNQLDAKQRAVLNYLHMEFGNTPLINLYLLTENADFEVYMDKMTYPYQPDSEDEAFVRRIVCTVRFYLEK